MSQNPQDNICKGDFFALKRTNRFGSHNEKTYLDTLT